MHCWARGILGMRTLATEGLSDLSFFFFLGVWLRWRPNGIAALKAYRPHLVVTAFITVLLYYGELIREGQQLGEHPALQLLLGGLPFQILALLCVLPILSEIPRPVPLILTIDWLGRGARYTFSVYLVHAPLLIILYRLWNSLGWPLAYWPIVPALTMTAWYLCRYTARLGFRHLPNPVLAILFGVARRGLRRTRSV